MLRRFLSVVAFAWLAGLPVAAQTTPVDSLRRAFALEKDPLLRADRYYDLAALLLAADPASGLLLADTLEQLGKASADPKSLARAAYLRGMAYGEQGKFDDALPFHRRELEIALQTGDLELQGKAYNSVGACFHSMGRNDSAIVYLVQAARIKEQVGNLKDLAAAYANIGNVFSDERAPDKAVEWLEKALAIRLSLPNGEKSAIVTYNNLSVAYDGKGDFDKALEYARKGYALAEESGQTFFAGVIAGSIGALLLEKDQVDQAIEMNERSVELLSGVNRTSNLVYPLSSLAKAWLRKGDPAKALAINRRGYAIMENLQLVEPLEEYYQNFAGIYEELGDYRQALDWTKKYMVLDDSLFNKEKLEAIAAVEAKFENEKKEAQLVRQELELAREANQKKNILFAALAGFLALGGGFWFFRNRQRIRQREAELAARQAEAHAEKLRETDALKSAFFANISHEFRTPLTLILSPLEQMINGSFRGDPQKYYRIIHRNGKRLLDLVNQLLDLSKLESGKLQLEVSEDDLGSFVRTVGGSFESLAARQQIDFRIEVPPAPVMAFFDHDKVEKVLVNLLSNAFKFTGENGRVTLELRPPDDRGVCTLVVQDTGIGIPADQLPHLFERFTQTTQSEIQPGSGIGLALTRELVLLHSGTLEVQSEEGVGTSFLVRLPTARNAFSPEQIVPAKKRAEPLPSPMPATGRRTRFSLPAPVGDKPLLLLAEDNADVRAYIAETLADQYQLLETENGRLALEKALDTTPDLIISDVMMPEMDGMELCRLLKTNEKTSHIPVILLTARAEQADKLQGLQTGADDYLVKPFDAQELLTRTANLIGQRQRLQEHYRRSLTAFAPAPVKADSMDAVFLQKIRETIETHLDDEHFSVVELGNQIGLSRSQLHRKLSALTGFSPNEVIRNMRLERARQLLEQRAGTVSEVAFLCGFSSPAYFIKCYKDYFGQTPGRIS